MGEPHKNKSRASIRPLNAPTLALTSLGLGFLRPAPGTWGSMPPVAIAGLLVVLGQTAPITPMIVTLFVVSCIACVVWGVYAEARFGRKDAAEVVIDETAGQCVTLAPLCVPMLAPAPDALVHWIIALGAAFVLFRAADVVKPWPARSLEKLPAGWGVLLDDLAAGVYGALVLAAGSWFLR